MLDSATHDEIVAMVESLPLHFAWLLDTGRGTALQILEQHTPLTDKDLQDLKLLDVSPIKGASFAK